MRIEKWIFPTILMTMAGGIYGAFLKTAQNFFSNEFITDSLFIFGLLVLIIINKERGEKFGLEKFGLLAGIAMGITQIFYTLSLGYTHNAGIPTAITRTQVLPTYMLSILLFNSKLNIKKLIGCLIVIGGAVLTGLESTKSKESMSSQKDNEKTKKNNIQNQGVLMIITATLAGLFSSANDVFSKYSIDIVSNSQYLYNEFLGAAVSTIILNRVFYSNKNQKLSIKTMSRFKIINDYPAISYSIVLLSNFFTLYFVGKAFKLADNIAYPRAVFEAGMVLLTTIIDLVLNKNTQLNSKEWIGIIITCIGAIITVLL